MRFVTAAHIFVTGVLLIVGSVTALGLTSTERNREARKLPDAQYKTVDGIRYRTTCLEGREFIVTHSGHGTTLASLGDKPCDSSYR